MSEERVRSASLLAKVDTLQEQVAAMRASGVADSSEPRRARHAEQVLRLASLSGHALGIQWARRSVSEVVELLEALRQAFRDEAHR